MQTDASPLAESAPPKPRLTLRALSLRVVHALPDAITASLFLATWIAPRLFSPEQIIGVQAIMGMEFLVMHSGIILYIAAQAVPNKGVNTPLLIVIPIYLLFALVLASGSHNIWLFWSFVWLQGNRLWLASQLKVRESERAKTAFGLSCIGLVFWMLCLMVSVVLPLPPFGQTRQVMESMHLAPFVAKSPYALQLFGLLYFGLRAAFKLRVDYDSADDGARQDRLIRF
jgi:hypothetical protein